MRTTLLLFCIFSLFSSLSRGSSIPFSPIVRSYSVSDYNAGIQNWSVAQDERGIMYIGNNKGLLEFDGSRWELHELPTKNIVRAVYIGEDGKIFVGSFEEFGYFERDSLDCLVYHSLKDEVKDFRFQNDEIWSIVPVQDEIVFQSFGSLFIYDGHIVRGIRTKSLPLNLFQVGDTFYSQLINEGLSIFINDGFERLIDRKLLGDSDVMAGLPYDDGALLLTRNSGGFIYQHGKVVKWHTECDAELEKYTVNRAVMTKDSCYIIGTISNGVYAIDKKGRLLWKENTDSRLQNNTVLGLYCDADNNVWVALDEGIAYILNNSLVYYYEPPYRKIGMIYDVLVKEDEAYVASNQGVYRMKSGKLELVPGLEEQAWYVKEWGNQILCGHNKGTFQIAGLQASLISDVRGAMCMREIYHEGHPLLLQGTYTFLNLYKENASGVWSFLNSLGGFTHMVRGIEMDHRGNIWVKHLRKGLFRLRISQDLKRVEDLKMYMELGDVKDGNFSLFKINGRVVFSNGKAFYTYEDMTDSIISYEVMNEQLPELKGINDVSHAGGNMYWLVSGRMAYLVKCEMNVFQVEHRIPFSLFEGLSIEERAAMVYDKGSKSSYLCLNNAIARIDADSSLLYKSPVKRSLWVSGITVEAEWTGKKKQLSVQEENKIEAEFSTVCFSLCYPVYNNYTYKVRYKLEGLNDQWVDNERSLEKKYTRLPFGSYVFKAEVYDGNQILASTTLPFVILRPWYLSYWAISGYVLAGLILLLLLQYIVYQSVKKKKDRVIEQQRIAHQAEIEQQEKKIIELEKEQLEADLRFKSKELSGVVMTNIAHQEFLNSLKEEIQQQKLSGQYTRKNLDKLLALVNNNIVSDEESWNMFQANFDRIHENFFRNLKQQYPDLTSGDLRFCALLRLNLPTKEIAKLLNISIRGVDAARYRLRKKFNLPQEDSLTDFMINFK
ncbi:triple tyrosine motif-containing protein [uncultured Bacteroides sp.]|uniref:triple tyrosine motif-containing protein n=1 Tax=uncultured Bacteroides sp. TaxID=162156 RepID=UPI002616493B|nr:triple tyrosine motif-containing protein [uncultured Bacteroides sp.]